MHASSPKNSPARSDNSSSLRTARAPPTSSRAQTVARAAPDGYTFLFATSAALVTNPYTFKKLPYDPVKDFVPVAMVARSNHVLLVNPEVKAKTLAELIALEKSAPGSLSMAVDGARNISGLIAQAINKQAGTSFVLVTYQYDHQRDQDSLTGRTQVTIQSASVAESFIKAGTLRSTRHCRQQARRFIAGCARDCRDAEGRGSAGLVHDDGPDRDACRDRRQAQCRDCAGTEIAGRAGARARARLRCRLR